MRPLVLSFLAAAALGCASAAAPPVTPGEPPAAAPRATPPTLAPGDPFALATPVRDERLPMLKDIARVPAKAVLAPPPPGLASAPAICAAFAARRAPAACKAADARDALDRAVTEADPARRDQLLADLEPCAGLPVGLARALRGEYAPTACGEAIQEPILRAAPAKMEGAVYSALLGQVIASRLARAGLGAPTLAPPYDKARVLAFTKGPLNAWFVEQASAVEQLSQSAAELTFYAQGLAAVEAGNADLRLVDAMRAAPAPKEFQTDPELKTAYYSSLDQVLDPRKDRGRDAVLVGLKQFAIVGALTDKRVLDARVSLSRHYGGRRIDALDALIVPALAAATPSTVDERLAAHLPTFYAGLVLDPKVAVTKNVFRFLAEHGVPSTVRAALAAASDISPEVRALYARARLASAQLYWRAVDVDQAAALASGFGAARPDDATLVLAIAIALRGGPDDAADMMRRAPRATPGEADVAALDAVAKGSANASAALFDAALVREVLTPQGAPATHFQDVARRYRDAASALSDAKAKAFAADRAVAADQTAAAVR
jgi:hypothetical protein